jgi:hypothetical protein
MIDSKHPDGPRLAQRPIVLAALVCAFVWVAPASATVITPVASRQSPVASRQWPVASCQSLATLDLSGNDAQVLTAQVTQLEQHSYCDVTGIISPQTHFDVVLPTAPWQGGYLQQRCGGFCGLNAGYSRSTWSIRRGRV